MTRYILRCTYKYACVCVCVLYTSIHVCEYYNINIQTCTLLQMVRCLLWYSYTNHTNVIWLSSKMKRIRICLLFHLIGNISSRVGTYEAKIHGTPTEFFWSASKADNGTAHCIYTMLLFMLRSLCNQRETTCSVLPVMAKYVSMYVLSLSCVNCIPYGWKY